MSREYPLPTPRWVSGSAETFRRAKLGLRPFSITGQTDTNGMFSAEAEGNPSGSCSARKEGYYPTLGVDFMFTNVVGDRWEPWNPTLEIVLRKIGKPMPMFAKRVEAFIPLMNEPVGFDLEKGDWVVPYGKGDVKDFTFLFRGRFASARDRDEALQITFSGPKDGIQGISASPSHGSQLRLPPEHRTRLHKPVGARKDDASGTRVRTKGAT